MKQRNPLQTVLVVTTGLIGLFLATRWPWAAYAALGTGLAGAFSPFLAHRIDFFWMKLADILGLFVPKVLLTAVFFLLLTPLAWLSKILGSEDALQLRNDRESMFKSVRKSFERDSFEKPW